MLGALVGLVLLGGGCASPPKRVDSHLATWRDSAPAKTAPTPPIRSEFQTWADRCKKESQPGAPRHRLAFLGIGDDALLTRIHLIRAARQSIDLQTFIWHDDPVSRAIFNELLAAARRGVRVRMLVDGLNVMGKPGAMSVMAHAHANLEVRLYRPIGPYAATRSTDFYSTMLSRTRHLNRRMHNKLFVIDDRIAIVGGRNYEAKYFDRNLKFNFKDFEVVVTGPCLVDIAGWFRAYWAAKSAVPLPQFEDTNQPPADGMCELPILDDQVKTYALTFEEADNYAICSMRPAMKTYAVNRVDFLSDHLKKSWTRRHLVGEEDVSLMMGEYILEAEERIIFQTPYLIYDRSSRDYMKRKRKQNPSFKIVVSSNGLAAADHIHVYAISYKHRKQLYKYARMYIYEFRPVPDDVLSFMPRYAELLEAAEVTVPGEAVDDSTIVEITREGPRLCLHSKLFVVDSKIAYVGSHNFDPRSKKYNTECGLIVHDDVFAGDLEAHILRDAAPGNSWTVGKRHEIPWFSIISRPLASISSALPVLDIWPFRYTTNFELIKGGTPCSPRAPEFDDNYRPVGDFPEVRGTGQTIQTRLIKAFGGWAAPLM